MNAIPSVSSPSREDLLSSLYEAAELEHNLMCTYLYAAFSLKCGEAEGLSARETDAVARWRRAILDVAIDEMGHLTAVWNITAALGGAPRFGRGNFPLDPGALPANIVVKLAPFSAEVLQHFIHLERPEGSSEPDGAGFEAERQFKRGTTRVRLTPMATDYETVGVFYTCLGDNLAAFVERLGEKVAFCGDPALQISDAEVQLTGAKPVICLKTALAAFHAIVLQGEGARLDAEGSHYQRFIAIRKEMRELKAANPSFEPAFPAAVNPVLRPPVRASRVWLENEEAFSTVDVANASYALMLRLLAYSYTVRRPAPEKGLAIDLAMGLMRAITHLAERAARLPAGPSNPECNAGMSFTALRDAAPVLPGASANHFFTERLAELAVGANRLAANGDARATTAARLIGDLARRGARGFGSAAATSTATPAQPTAAVKGQTMSTTSSQPAASSSAASAAAGSPPVPTVVDGVDHIEGKDLMLLYDGKKCIHARFCVTGAPNVFLANVKGPWINPDAVGVDRLVEIAHACPSGAIRYARKDGKPDETPPPVNLIAVREAGPYAVRGQLTLDGEPISYRVTLCRCGASKNKPFCDGSHHEVQFAATGEPPTTNKTDMLPVRDGPLAIDPQTDGPLQVTGNLEITSGTGRVVTRVVKTWLCRCGGSNNKPFCDGTHSRIGFKST
jgi:CDGSH-type Zn-finger protein/uncharacterized Fe-S cluster protein YjdI